MPGGGTRWIALNTTIKPFDNLNVRKAIIAGFDRDALRLTRGGEEVGPIAQSFLPPGIRGFEESGGEKGFTDFDWMQKPEGDPALSKKYMLAAGKEGVPVTPTASTPATEKFLTIATNADPGLQTAQVAQTEFDKLGFKLNFRKVPQDTLYTKFCDMPEGEGRDLPERRLVQGLHRSGVDARADVRRQGDQARRQRQLVAARRPGDQRGDGQGGADVRRRAQPGVGRHQQEVVAQAPGIPYVWDDSFQLASKDLSAVMNGYSTTWDLTYSSVK